MEEKYYFDRKTTNIMKGIGILLMLFMHFFTYESWHTDIVSYPVMAGLFERLREPTRMCVGLFAFITGYTFALNRDRSILYPLKKIRNIYIVYWIFFIPFEIIAYTCGGKAFALGQFIREIFAVETSTMTFCWYVLFYCVAILLLWALRPLLDKSPAAAAGWGIFGAQAVISIILGRVTNDFVSINVRNLSDWFIVLVMGYIVSRYSVFEKYDAVFGKIKKEYLRLIIAILLLIISFAGRYFFPRLDIGSLIPTSGYGITYSFNMNVIYTPVFVFALIDVIRIFGKCKAGEYVGRAIGFLGSHSLEMWFFSCIFFGKGVSTIFMKVLYLPKIWILVYIWGTLICLAVSVPVKKLIDIILKKRKA